MVANNLNDAKKLTLEQYDDEDMASFELDATEADHALYLNEEERATLYSALCSWEDRMHSENDQTAQAIANILANRVSYDLR